MSDQEEQAQILSSKDLLEEPTTVAQLRENGSESIRGLFDALEERIRTLDEAIEEKPTKYYVAFRLAKNFAVAIIGRNQIELQLRSIDHDDPRGFVEKVPDKYNWTLDRRIRLNSPADLDYVFGIVEQSYKNVL